MTAKRLSILVPTTNSRRAFWPWLWWNIRKQQGLDWSSTEVVFACENVVLSPQFSLASRCVVTPADASIGAKRNALLEAARGEYVAWMDDDDWQHPLRIAGSLGLLGGSVRGVFEGSRYYLKIVGEMRELKLKSAVAAVSFVGLRDEALSASFEDTSSGEDSQWARKLLAANGSYRLRWIVRGPSFAGLHHGQNTTSKILSRWRWNLPWGALAEKVGPEAWGDTDEQIRQLRERLGLA